MTGLGSFVSESARNPPSRTMSVGLFALIVLFRVLVYSYFVMTYSDCTGITGARALLRQ